MFDTPILLLVFNRVDTTAVVLNRIREIKPRQLFIAADGPRSGKEGENDKCKQVKAVIDEMIDWECDVHKLYRKRNLGCGLAVSSAIDWFFNFVDRGIILEDDILPDITFFKYCQILLNHYENNTEIMHINGSNLQAGIKRGNGSYYFSSFPGIWGWATWKRAWLNYTFNFSDDSESEILSTLQQSVRNENDVNHLFDSMISVKTRMIDTWDYQWVYTLFKYKGLCIIPEYNLVKNIGFDSNGTHTTFAPFWYKYLISRPVHVTSFIKEIEINNKADDFTFALTMGRRNAENIYIKILYKIKKYFWL